MPQEKTFNDILSECLDRILKGEAVEQCLQRYPKQAPELEPLLRTALKAKAASTITTRPEFRARARYEFQLALREMASKKQSKFAFNWHPQWRWQSGWAIGIVSALVVIIGGGSTVFAASSSMPDSALYPVKLATEQVQLAVTPSDSGKAELNATFADRRAEEIAYLASKGDTPRIRAMVQVLNSHLQKINDLTARGKISTNQEGNTTGSLPKTPLTA